MKLLFISIPDNLKITLFLLILLLVGMGRAEAIQLKVDQVTLNPPAPVANSFTTINLRQTYPAAPLIFILPTNQGVDPASIRIRNVTTTSFEIGVFEPTGSDGIHPGMTVSYIAVSPGVHTLPDGTIIEAGSIATTSVVQKTGGSAWAPLVFANVFPAAPTIQVQIQSTANEPGMLPGTPSVPWLTAKANAITTTGVQVALERSETSAFGTVVLPETIAYLAIPAGASTFLDNAAASVTFEALNSGNTINGPGCTVTNFAGVYASPPLAGASMITRNGADGGWLRECSLTATALGLVVDEDTTTDADRNHTNETASIVAFSQAFDLLLAGGGLEAGPAVVSSSSGATATWTQVVFPNAFDTTPLIFALPTNAGANPASLRLRNISVSGFEIAAFEPINETGAHPSMTASYIAIEPGSYTLASGVVFEAGSILTAAEQLGSVNPGPGVSSWATLNFAQPHATPPATLLQIQTSNNEFTIDPSNVSIPFQEVAATGITTTGMQVAIERAEAAGYAGPVVAENIAYLAIANGSIGTLQNTLGGTINYESILSGVTILGWDNGCYTTAFAGVYLTLPIAIASQAMRLGNNGGWVRECSRTTAALGLTVDEDRAQDAERAHTAESASILVFDQAFEAQLSPLITFKKELLPAPSPRIPGTSASYLLTVSNTGNSAAESVLIEDPISNLASLKLDTYGVGMPFEFVDSLINPSGLGMGIPNFSDDNGATWVYVPATTGTDSIVTNWRIPFTGTMSPSGSFTLGFEILVD